MVAPTTRPIYLNIGYRLSSGKAGSGGVLGPIVPRCGPCIGGFIRLLQASSKGNHPPENTDLLRLFDTLDPVDTFVLSATTPNRIQDVHDDDFETMRLAGTLCNVFEVPSCALQPESLPNAMDSANQPDSDFRSHATASETLLPAHPSDEVTKKLASTLGLNPDLPVYTVYFVSQTCIPFEAPRSRCRLDPLKKGEWNTTDPSVGPGGGPVELEAYWRELNKSSALYRHSIPIDDGMPPPPSSYRQESLDQIWRGGFSQCARLAGLLKASV